jgi:heme exporter protein CcmD
MNHLAYIVPSYALAVLVLIGFSASAWARMRRAQRRLAAVDRRARP